MNSFTKTFLISVIFFTLFFSLGVYNFSNFGKVNNSIDFDSHWKIVNDFSYKPDYPHYYHYLFQVFNQNELAFYVGNLLLICLIIPLMLFYGTKTAWSTVIYFMGVSLPHMWLYGATYPQALTFLLLIIYLFKRKNPIVFLICGGLASLIHQAGLELFALVLIAEIIAFLIEKYSKRWAKQLTFTPKMYVAGAIPLAVQRFIDISHYIFFLLTQVSPVIWFYAKKVIYQPFWLILTVIPLLLMTWDARIFSVTQIALLFVVTPELVKAKHKKTIIFFLIIQLIFFLLEFGLGTTNLIKR